MRNTRQRREQIMQSLIRDGAVHVSDLAAHFGVSSVTIRADLNHIESQGLATRNHGGATLVRTPPVEQDIHEKDEEYLRRCRENAAYVVERCGWTRIDCARGDTPRTIEDIHNEVMARVADLIG